MGKDLRSAVHHPLAQNDDPYYYVSTERYWKEMLYIPPYFTIPQEYLDAKPDYVDLAQLSKLKEV
jgi:hypothetical protein